MSASEVSVHLIRGRNVFRIDDTRFTYVDETGKRRTDAFIGTTALPLDGVNRLVLLVAPAPGVDLSGVVVLDATAEELAGGKR